MNGPKDITKILAQRGKTMNISKSNNLIIWTLACSDNSEKLQQSLISRLYKRISGNTFYDTHIYNDL